MCFLSLENILNFVEKWQIRNNDNDEWSIDIATPYGYLFSNLYGHIYCYPKSHTTTSISLQWRHNERDGVSNHEPHDCLLNRLFRHRWNKTYKLRVTDLCEGNSPVNGETPAHRASNEENVTIWWRHHVLPFCFSCYHAVSFTKTYLLPTPTYIGLSSNSSVYLTLHAAVCTDNEIKKQPLPFFVYVFTS